MIDQIISMRWTAKCWSPTIVGMSVVVRPTGELRANDCSSVEVRDRINAEFATLPFLGTLTCGTEQVVAGSVEEFVFPSTVA